MKSITAKTLVLLATVFASTNSYAALIPANSYQCVGKNITVNYSSSSIIGEAQLTITIGKRAYGAMGNERITTQQTVLGNLISIIKTAQPDLYTDTLTLLLPDINVSTLGERVNFKSQLLTTHTVSSIAGSALVKGVIQSNSAKTINCTATAVVF